MNASPKIYIPYSRSGFDRINVGNDAIGNCIKRSAFARVDNEVVVGAVAPGLTRVVVVVAGTLCILLVELFKALAFVNRLAALLAVFIISADEDVKVVVIIAKRIVCTAAEEDARTIFSNLTDDGRLAHEHSLARLAHVRTKRMERDEAQRERLYRVLHLEEFILTEVVDAELSGC